MAPFGELSYLAYPEFASQIGLPLRQLERDQFSTSQPYRVFGELLRRPVRPWKFVISQNGDPFVFHLAKELRAVGLPVEDQREAVLQRIFLHAPSPASSCR